MNITVKNYLEERAKIDFSKLPEKYKKVDEFITEAIDFYGQDAEIDKTIDQGIKQLNEKVKEPVKEEPKLNKKTEDWLNEENEEQAAKAEKVKKAFAKEAKEKAAEAKEKQLKAGTEAAYETAEEAAKRKEEYKKEVESELHKIVSGGDMSMAQIVAEGRRINELRSFRSQFIDNGSDNKRRLTPTKENLVRWMKNPGRFDLIGVDTASATDATADLKHVKKETILHLIGFKK